MGFGDFIGNNAVSVDAASEETSVRSKYPQLLHPEEHIELALRQSQLPSTSLFPSVRQSQNHFPAEQYLL